MWKRHTPGKRSRLTVIAVSRNEAADPADSIADRGRRTCNVQHGQHADAVSPPQEEQHGDAGDESAEPGESLAKPHKEIHEPRAEAPQPAKALQESGKIRDRPLQNRKVQPIDWSINYVPQLASDDAREGHTEDNGVRIDLELAP